jgi:hypothetical protein
MRRFPHTRRNSHRSRNLPKSEISLPVFDSAHARAFVGSDKWQIAPLRLNSGVHRECLEALSFYGIGHSSVPFKDWAK